jgi:hypothetical protein
MLALNATAMPKADVAVVEPHAADGQKPQDSLFCSPFRIS